MSKISSLSGLYEICESVINTAIAPDTRYLLVACSGGADSIVLLDILEKYCNRHSKVLVCAHINHGLRAAESDADEQFVRDYCQRRQIIIECRQVDTNREKNLKKAGVEAAARDLRYVALRAIAAAYQPTKIFVAHNQNDQAETVLLKLIRGAGTRGLAAMQFVNEDIVRPLLGISRAAIEQYCTDNNINYCFDQSNNDINYLRNSVRKTLLPLLTEYNPNIVQTLSRTATIAQAEEQYLHDVTVEYQLKCVEFLDNRVFINKTRFGNLPVAIQRRIIRSIITTLGCYGTISFEKVENIRQQATGRVSTVVEIIGDLQSRNCYDHLELCYNNKHIPEPQALNERSLPIPGVIDLNATEHLNLELMDRCDNICSDNI